MPALRLLFLLALAACLGATRPAWVERQAIPLADWPAALPAAVTAAITARHRFVMLGEGDHYIHDKYSYRLALLRPLIARGVRHVAMELGGSDAARIDRYLETGDEAWLDRVVLYGYAGATELERRELAPFANRNRACGDRFAADERAFFRALRTLSEAARATGDRLHLFGFDFDVTPGGGFEDARQALASCTAPELDALRPQLTPPRGSSGLAEVARLEALAGQLATPSDALRAACGDALATASHALARLAFSYETSMAWSATQQDQSPTGLARYREMFDTREQHMERELTGWLATLPADAPVAMLGHNLHLARRAEQLRFGRAPHDLPMWPSLGTRLERAFPGTTYVIWLLYARGHRLAPQPTGACEAAVDTADDHLERALVGDRPAYLPLAGAPPDSVLDRPIDFGTDTSEGSGTIRGAVDAIVILPTASAPP